MDDLEEKLNEQKNRMNTERFNQMKDHSTFESSISTLKHLNKIKANAQNITKAFLKFIDILKYNEFFHLLTLQSRTNGEPVKIFFNAELPGAFVYATNHMFKAYNIKYEWVASSYIPSDSNGDAIEDQYGLFQKYQNHIMSRSNDLNGDMTNPNMVIAIANRTIQRIGKVTLYTADGGFDVSGRENEQEILSIPLIRGEFECGFLTLAPGGFMIVKIFTLFTDEMRDILANAAIRFKKWAIMKPDTSSPINSELYFIGIGYLEHPIGNYQTIRETICSRSNEFALLQIEAIKQFFQGKTETVSRYVLPRIERNQWL